MNVNEIELVISQKINSTTSNLDLLMYAKALQILKTNGVFTVATNSALPAASSNPGKLYFIEDIRLLVYSEGSKWRYVITREPAAQLWAWGSNSGQIGDNTVINRSSPVREITCDITWCLVAGATFTHSVAVKVTGSLWSWGRNCLSAPQQFGTLGDNTLINRSSPVQEITCSNTWCEASTASYHTVAVKADGTLWGWGCNSCGMLGDNSLTRRSSPVREASASTNWCIGSAMYLSSTAIKTQGTLWSWGNGSCGILGTNSTASTSSPVQEITKSSDWCTVVGRGQHNVAMKLGGSVWSWGTNICGEIGDISTICRSSPVQEITCSTNWCSVSAAYHTVGIKSDNTLWTWGLNNCGQLGISSVISISSPVRELTSSSDWCTQQTGSSVSAAVKTTGQLWSWGNNNGGALGDRTTVHRSSPIREITSGTNWSRVSAGNTTMALKYQ